jgi:hypothetical protein
MKQCPKYLAREEAARAELVRKYNWRLLWVINALTAIQWICYWTGYFGVIH